MSKYTKGPWEIAHGGTAKDGKFEITEYFVRVPDDDVSIAADIINPKTGNPSEANAQLISAAPELLEACKHALRWHKGDKWRNSSDTSEVKAWEVTNNILEQAITKAEGRGEK